ncbi:MAG: hypothetical protein KatS3mg026_1274 [Bacteroidia bacterium]|nr:MAG: hypothetical protein KatS3mg026_1274 [Bacteroidia bacterium]
MGTPVWAISLLIGGAFAQRLVADTLYLRFYSDAPLEKITAENTRGVYSFLDLATDSVFVRIKIRGFSFPNKLMEEHFNENYLESEKYPYAYFRGKLVAPVPYPTPGTYAVSAKGLLQIHGVAQERVLSGVFEIQPNGIVLLSGKAYVKPADHRIAIPRLLTQKIAETVEVTWWGRYKPAP